jgi:hypothetical protein
MPREAKCEGCLTYAFRARDKVCMVHAPLGEFMYEVRLNCLMPKQVWVCARLGYSNAFGFTHARI